MHLQLRLIWFPQAPELGGGKVRRGAESTGQSTVIVKAAIVSDVRDWPIGFDEQARGGGEPCLHNELVWSNAKDALDEPGEADWGQTGAFCE